MGQRFGLLGMPNWNREHLLPAETGGGSFEMGAVAMAAARWRGSSEADRAQADSV